MSEPWRVTHADHVDCAGCSDAAVYARLLGIATGSTRASMDVGGHAASVSRLDVDVEVAKIAAAVGTDKGVDPRT